MNKNIIYKFLSSLIQNNSDVIQDLNQFILHVIISIYHIVCTKIILLKEVRFICLSVKISLTTEPIEFLASRGLGITFKMVARLVFYFKSFSLRCYGPSRQYLLNENRNQKNHNFKSSCSTYTEKYTFSNKAKLNTYI